jgi:hypothetical protein
VEPDRIFYSVKTEQMVLSASDGFMPSDADWIQVGTLDVNSPVQNKPGFKGRVQID